MALKSPRAGRVRCHAAGSACIRAASGRLAERPHGIILLFALGFLPPPLLLVPPFRPPGPLEAEDLRIAPDGHSSTPYPSERRLSVVCQTSFKTTPCLDARWGSQRGPDQCEKRQAVWPGVGD